MKIKSAICAVILLFPVAGLAATVEYQHPQVTIVAEDESLDSVLTDIGREMNLTVTTPIGINPVINCDIQSQPIERAFKNLLGDLSYSLVWADDGERLTGLVILAGDGESAEVAVSERQSSSASDNQVASVPDASGSHQSAVPAVDHSGADPQRAEHEAQMEIERQEREVRRAEEREVHEAEMAQRREGEEIAHKARMVEERARREEQNAAYIESMGYPLPE